MKKLITSLAVYLLSNLPIGAFVVDSIAYNKIGINEVEVTLADGSVKMPQHLVIPERVTYNGVTYVVKQIGYLALQYHKFSSISIPNTVVLIDQNAFLECDVPQVIIPKSVKTIAPYAFTLCKAASYVFGDGVESIGNEAFNLYASNDLNALSLPVSLKTIGKKCFCGEKLTSVSCAAIIPPILADTTSFYFRTESKTKVDTLFVPTESVEAYKQSLWARKFKYILPHDFVENIISTPTEIRDESVIISFRVDTNVVQYNINLYQDGVPFAEYVVNNQGEVVSQDYLSRLSENRGDLPAVESQEEPLRAVRKMMTDTTTNTTDYFVITIDGLQAGKRYTYTIRGINAAGLPIYDDMGEFQTTGISGLQEAINNEKKKNTLIKILHRSNIYILHPDGSLYDMKGTKVNLKIDNL